MDTTEISHELHLTVANEDYLECLVRIEQEGAQATDGIRSRRRRARSASRRRRSTRP